MIKHAYLTVCLMICLLGSGALAAAELRIAVAANFHTTLSELADQFVSGSAAEVSISSASSGVLYNQILHGAPFDLYLSADEYRPAKLAEKLGGEPFVYALGKLVWWQPGTRHPENASIQTIIEQYEGRLAIANPALAPYGAAALDLIQRATSPAWQLVTGTSVNQAFQFVHSGNAGAGLVPLALVRQAGAADFIPINETEHRPIRQAALITNQKNATAHQFANFLRSEITRKLLLQRGYGLP